MASFIKWFFLREKSLYACEFGHSVPEHVKKVGPWSREMYLLHFVVRGHVDFSGFRAEAGQAFLISKEQMHSFTVSEDYEHFWIGFDGDSVEKIFDGFHIDCRRHQLFCVEDADFLKGLFSHTLHILQSENNECAEAVVLATLMGALPLLKKEDQIEAYSKINYAEKVFIHIKTNYMYPLKMGEIAKELYISEKYMYRLFVQKYRISPQEHLKRTRMALAAELLKQGKCSVTEVSNLVGYTSLPIFTKAFTKHYGLSPSAFKKEKINGSISHSR